MCKSGSDPAGDICGDTRGEWPCFGVNGDLFLPNGLGLYFNVSAAK